MLGCLGWRPPDRSVHCALVIPVIVFQVAQTLPAFTRVGCVVVIICRMTIFTVGYQGLSLSAFKLLLFSHGIQTLVDVREFPISRKPGFSKNALKNASNESGLTYTHMPTLGCPRPVRNQYREDGDWSRYTNGFLSHLNRQAVAIAQLSEMAQLSRCALLCFEADFNRCHRSMVAYAVSQYCGASVAHLSAAKTTAACPV